MSEEKAEGGSGCWGLLWGLFVVVCGYGCALNSLAGEGGTHLWWHYLAAIPLAGLWLAFIFALPYVLAPAVCACLAAAVYGGDHFRWLVGEGIGFLVIGLVVTGLGGSNKSAVAVWNGVVIALIGIVAGIIGWVKLHP